MCGQAVLKPIQTATVGNTWHVNHTVSLLGFGVTRWSSAISTRVLQALSQPEPSQRHWSGADAGTAIWSSPSTLGTLREKKQKGLQNDKRSARASRTPSSRTSVDFFFLLSNSSSDRRTSCKRDITARIRISSYSRNICTAKPLDCRENYPALENFKLGLYF